MSDALVGTWEGERHRVSVLMLMRGTDGVPDFREVSDVPVWSVEFLQVWARGASKF